MALPQKPFEKEPGARNVYDWAVKAQLTHFHFHYRLFRERLVLTLEGVNLLTSRESTQTMAF